MKSGASGASITTLNEIVDRVKGTPTKRLSVAVAEDPHTIGAVGRAVKEGLVHAVLTGDRSAIRKVADENKIDAGLFEIVHEPDKAKALSLAIDKVRSGQADFLMKGLLDSSLYIRGIIDKEKGLLPPGKLLSHVTVIQVPTWKKLIICGDVAVIPAHDLEAKIANAADRALGLELAIFERLAEHVIAAAETIKGAAQALAALDVTAGLAMLAAERDYVRPEIVAGLDFSIAGGRHPVVEQAIDAPFVANDCELSPPADASAGRIYVVTGPNMAGKSTYLRQNALIAVMAQMGSFVPAKRARIGVVDRLFSRVGAADDLARGRSTFMVEMVETAAILNQAGGAAGH